MLYLEAGRMNDVVAIGVGNLLMSDEGIGICVIRRLLERKSELRDVDIVDCGVSGASLLHVIAGRRKAVIIDCARLGEEPGAIIRFEPQDVKSRKILAGLSDHDADVLGIIEFSRSLGECPGKVVIFGIQPETVTPGTELSQTLLSRLDEYADMVTAELKEDRNA